MVSSGLFSLISEFTVLDFCELYSDVHCPIVLKLNIMNVLKADLKQFEINEDCINDDYVDKTNLQYTGRPKWYKTRGNEYISVLDDAKIKEISMLLDEELLSPKTTALNNINRIVVKNT